MAYVLLIGLSQEPKEAYVQQRLLNIPGTVKKSSRVTTCMNCTRLSRSMNVEPSSAHDYSCNTTSDC